MDRILKWIELQVRPKDAPAFYAKSILLVIAAAVATKLLVGSSFGTVSASLPPPVEVGLIVRTLGFIVVAAIASLIAVGFFIAGPTHVARAQWPGNVLAIVLTNCLVGLILAIIATDNAAGFIHGYYSHVLTVVVYLKNGGLSGGNNSIVKTSLFLMVCLTIGAIVF